MVNTLSFLERLEHQLSGLEPIIDLMMNNSSIFYNNPNDNHRGILFLGASVYHWGKKDEKSQIIAKEKYLKFYENFGLLLEKAQPNTLKLIQKSNKDIINLIEQNEAPSSTASGKALFRSKTKVFKDYLKLLTSGNKRNIIVPDTNSIIQYPDPINYAAIVNTPDFEFVILPTVLSELDRHKNSHRSDDFRKKVGSVIKRLKGYRKQGDVLTGVIVNKTLIVRMIATEPNFDKTLSWIDAENNDDRIIANVLELQITHPGDNIILVTSDINLQNKAQMANLTAFDTDDLEEEEKI